MTARHCKYTKRMRRAIARKTRNSFTHLFTFAAVPLFFVLPFAANAQAAPGESVSTPSLAMSGLEIFSGKSAKSTSASPGTGVSEVLRGNGSRIGYKVSHGNLVAETVRVRAAGQQLQLDRDFWVDTASGSLIFAQPVRSADSISVYYRYLDGPAAGAGASMQGLQLNFGGSASLGLMFNSIAGDGSGLDTSLYGLQLGGKLGGGGIAQFNGMAYFSQTQVSTNIVNSATAGAVKPPADVKPGMDHLITQNFAVNSGKLQFHADFQDVGKGFAGFQALKASSANNKALLDQLTALENEKGVKRLGFGLNLANDLKSKTPGGLSLQFNRIEDGKGAIAQQSLGYTSHNFRFNYSTREIDAKFAAFKGLREADKTQWEREKGLKTTTLGFGMDFATDKKGQVTGGLDFASQNFKDKTGSLSQELIRGNSGGLGFSLMNRRADANFKRLGDLSEADKTALALDLYHQFDPNAKAEQVTAVDRLQVLKEAGLSRNALRLDDSLGKTGQLSYSQMHITNNAAADPKAQAPATSETFQRESFGLNTAQFTLNYTARKADPGFNRIGDLADVEKNNLALDTRRQFDPNAKIEQVTQKDRDQLAKESGIERTNLRGLLNFGKAGKFGALTFSQFRIADHTAKDPMTGSADAIGGALLGYTGKTFQLNFSSKTIGNRFNRMADLSDLDRQQFGNTRGLSQQALNGSWQINKAAKFTFSNFDVAGTKDAIAAAQADALKNNQDVALAGKTAQSGISRTNIALEAPGLSLSAGQANTGREFARSVDLPLPDADKHLIETERGTKRNDYALHFARIKGMTLDGSFYDAADAERKLDHKLEKVNAQYLVNKKTNLSFKSDVDLTVADGKKTGIDHTVITFNQEIGKSFLFNLLHDANAVYDKDTPTPQSAKTDSLHFETPKAKPNNFNFDIKRMAYLDGRYENTTNLNLHAKPTSSLTFNYTHQEIDRGQGTPDPNTPVTPAPVNPINTIIAPSESTEALDGQWQATKQFAVVFGFSQRETTDKTGGDTVSIGLKGDPVKNVTMTAKFDEVHTDGKNTKDVADFAFSNAKPFRFGCIQDLTITARYASLNDQRKLQNETMTGRAAWKIWKNEFLLDYGGLTKQNGEITISRIYSFTTDPNPKKWFHGGFYYKARTMVDGTERLIRRFSADWRLNRATTFAYTFGTLPEDDKGNILPQIKADVSLKHTIQRDLSLETFYRSYNDDATKKVTRSLGFGIEGKLNRTTKLALAYSLDATGDSANYDHSNHYHFLIDHQMDADHFLTLSTEIKSHDGKDLKDDVRANVDFRVIF
jgi:hypothetical protein